MTAWTPERRQKHAQSIRRWAPWGKSTGPRTAAGKARSARNAYKHGKRSVDSCALRALITNQKRLHAAAASRAKYHENATNELLADRGYRMLNDAVFDGLHLLVTLLGPSLMQKPCILGPPEGKG